MDDPKNTMTTEESQNDGVEIEPTQSVQVSSMPDQSVETLTNPNSNTSEKSPATLASNASNVLNVLFLILAGILIILKLTEKNPNSSFGLIFYILFLTIALGVSVMSSVLYIISYTRAFKNTPNDLADISILLSGSVIGVIIMWLPGDLSNGEYLVAASSLLACVFFPRFALTALKYYRACHPSQSRSQNGSKIFACISALTIVIWIGIVLFCAYFYILRP